MTVVPVVEYREGRLPVGAVLVSAPAAPSLVELLELTRRGVLRECEQDALVEAEVVTRAAGRVAEADALSLRIFEACCAWVAAQEALYDAMDLITR